jgi:hypothetical protein
MVIWEKGRKEGFYTVFGTYEESFIVFFGNNRGEV